MGGSGGRLVLTVVVPTLGRLTLERTLNSLAWQLTDEDEVLVVADTLGDAVAAARMTREILDERAVVFGPGGDWGHTQRNWAVDNAVGTYVWCLADDDEAAPGALDALRKATKYGSWHLFRVQSTGELGTWTIPDDHEIREENVDAECILAPRTAKARWGSRYQGDLDYALALQEELGDPIWHDDIVAYVRPREAAA